MATAAKATDTAPAPPPATTSPTQYFIQVDVDQIAPDPDQPRKTFDEAELAELADSIKVKGVIVPLLLRELPDKLREKKQFVLIAGERRWRAAKKVGLASVPALVETSKLSPADILEIQILENSYRPDVPPLEEAEAYQRLMKQFGYTMDKLIAKTKKSKAHLYGRLKLLELAPGAKKAVQSGKLLPAIAELIARIPDQKLQEQATKDVLGQGGNDAYSYDSVQPEKIANGEHGTNPQPLSFRASIQLIRRRYQTQFDLQRFDPADKTLVPKAGACVDCPYRAGNQPMLPGLTPAKGLDDDYCTNAPCFEAKVDATFKEKANLAKGKGLKVIEGAPAKKILSSYSGDINYDANYADPKASLPHNIAKPGSNATWAGLLGKKFEEVPRVFVQDPNTGAGRELLVKDKAIEMLRELGKIDKAEKSSSSKADAKAKEARKKHLDKNRFNEQALVRALGDAAEKTAKDTDGKRLLAQLRWLARAVIRDYAQSGGDGGEVVLERRGVESYDDLEAAVEKARSIGEVLAVLAELELGIHSEAKLHDWYGKDGRQFFDDGLKLFGADWDKALAAAKEASKAEQKSDAAKEKKADAKKPAKKKGGGK